MNENYNQTWSSKRELWFKELLPRFFMERQLHKNMNKNNNSDKKTSWMKQIPRLVGGKQWKTEFDRIKFHYYESSVLL